MVFHSILKRKMRLHVNSYSELNSTYTNSNVANYHPENAWECSNRANEEQNFFFKTLLSNT